jgi:proline iminopeptidase
MREGFLKIDGHKIWYSAYGEGKKGTPLLVLHGGPGFLSMPEVVRDLASDRPVFFYDQYGCGRSGRAPAKADYSVKGYVRELDGVRRELGLGSFYLMGFSWGTALACSYLLDKKTAGVKGLILCGPYLSTARWDADQRENIARMPPKVRKAIEEGEAKADYGEPYQSAMMDYYRKHVCRLDPWPDSLQKAFSQLNPDVYQTLWGPSEFTITGTLKDLDLLPDLHRIQEPVLLVCGDADEAGVKTVKDYQTAFTNARMAVIPKASHLHHIEQPEIFKTVVRNFLSGSAPT